MGTCTVFKTQKRALDHMSMCNFTNYLAKRKKKNKKEINKEKAKGALVKGTNHGLITWICHANLTQIHILFGPLEIEQIQISDPSKIYNMHPTLEKLLPGLLLTSQYKHQLKFYSNQSNLQSTTTSSNAWTCEKFVILRGWAHINSKNCSNKYNLIWAFK